MWGISERRSGYHLGRRRAKVEAATPNCLRNGLRVLFESGFEGGLSMWVSRSGVATLRLMIHLRNSVYPMSCEIIHYLISESYKGVDFALLLWVVSATLMPPKWATMCL